MTADLQEDPFWCISVNVPLLICTGFQPMILVITGVRSLTSWAFG